VLALGAWGCGQGSAATPDACLDGPEAVRAALANAPDGAVAMKGVKLSDCLVPASDPSGLEAFGGSVIQASAELADKASAGDERALVQIGFLRGALARGADAGLQDNLLLRVDQELNRIDRSSPAYRRGEAAGKARG
jgi:hypothetical protein